VLPQNPRSPPAREQRRNRRGAPHRRATRPNRSATSTPPVTPAVTPPAGGAAVESRSATQGSVAVAGGGGQVAGPSGAPADSNGTGTNSDSGATSSGVAGDQSPGTVGTGGTAGTGPPSAASLATETGTQPGESAAGTLDQTAIGAGGNTGTAPSGSGPGEDASGQNPEALGTDSDGANDGANDDGDAADGHGIGEGEGAGHGSGVGQGHSAEGGEHHSSERGGHARERQGSAPGGSPRRVPGADGAGARSGTGRSPGAAEPGPSGTGTETGGATVPGSDQGQPAPPGLQRNGDDPNGSADGSLYGTRGGTSDTGSTQGTGHGVRRGTGGHGGSDGSPRGGDRGSPQGAANRREDMLDTASRWAGYANFEFGNGSSRGVAHGVPGGQGRLNLGRFGQVLHIALTIASWVGVGGLIRAVRLGFRGIVRAGMRAMASSESRLALLSTRRAVSDFLRRLFTRAPRPPVPTIRLYRGVNSSHFRFAEQSTGLVRPNRRWWQFWRPRSSPLEHNVGRGGTLDSPFSSWTTDPRVAENFALRPGPSQGVVISADVPITQTVVSPNLKEVVLIQGGGLVSEAEVLVRGVVRGVARLIRP
jgi:hypothetical protein